MNVPKMKKEHLMGISISLGVFVGGLLVLALLFDFVIMPLTVKEGAETRVPDVVNLSMRAAEAKLGEVGLETIEGDEEFDSDRPKGTVISQRPEGGATVKKGRRVFLTISKGSASATVPQLEGFSLREARFLLEKEGLQPGGILWMTQESRPDGVILGSIPGEGTVMKLNASVELIVNRKETDIMVSVPEFVGLDLEEARILAEENYLLIGDLDLEVNNELLPETVIDQSIEAGDLVRKWSVVDLTVSVLE
jgi:beta-lactam-binding protein with PASTA domain